MLRWFYKILRFVVVTVLLAAVLVPAVLYVALSLPPVQDRIRREACRELSALLGVDVAIGRVSVTPFNSVTLADVAVTDSLGREMMTVKRIGAGIDLMQLLTGDLRVSYAELYGLDGRLTRDTPGSPLNIQPVIDRLSPKDRTRPPTRFELAINTVVIRKSRLSYDVLSEPLPEATGFSPHHLAVADLSADVTLPVVSNDLTEVDLKRLAFVAPGNPPLVVSELSGRARLTPSAITLSSLLVEMPSTRLAFGTIEVPLHAAPASSLPVGLRLLAGSRVTPADLAFFLPRLAALSRPIDLELELSGTPADLTIGRLTATMRGDGATSAPLLAVDMMARVRQLTDGLGAASLTLPRLSVKADAPRLLEMAGGALGLSPALTARLSPLGAVDITAEGGGSMERARVVTAVTTSAGAVDVTAQMEKRSGNYMLSGHVEARSVNVGRIALDRPDLPPLGLEADVSFTTGTPLTRRGAFDGRITNLTVNNYTLADITADLDLDGTMLTGLLNVSDPNLSFSVGGHAAIPPGDTNLDIVAEISGFNPHAMGLTPKWPGYTLDTRVEATLAGSNIDNINGHVGVSGFSFSRPDAADGEQARSLMIDRIDIAAHTDSLHRSINIDSDIVNGEIAGRFSFARLLPAVKHVAACINPEIFDPAALPAPPADLQTLDINLTVEPDNPLARFLALPVEMLAPVTLSATLDSGEGVLTANVSAPYLQSKNKLIEGTSLSFLARSGPRVAELHAASVLPTKAGPMTLLIDSHGINGRHDSEIQWSVHDRPNYGDLRFTTSLRRDSVLTTRVDVNPGRIVFNDTVWTVDPSVVTVANRRVAVRNFRVSHSNQLLLINGTAAADTVSALTLTLRDINLDYVFDTLNIPNVDFGGDATGVFHASRLFTKAPVAYTDNLYVAGLSYNGCVMGNGHIRSAWHPEGAGDITINAVIDEPGGRKSYVDGSIHPTRELLDFRFRADRAPVGFLRPFMAAFCDDISGYASGDAHLYGTFKLLDMQGDVYAEDIAMDIGFTNTTYHATDSIHIAPGRIELDDIAITDDRGRSAKLSGVLLHKDFKEPRFRFRVTDARDFLAYDIKPNQEHPWYGTVYGTGSVTITGEPGRVDINVDMATGEGTDFTFVLDDSEVASDYSFITFRDKTPAKPSAAADEEAGAEPLQVRLLRERLARRNADPPTAYAMTFNIDVTPKARVTLVMDPAGGDKIRATGQGTLRMSYDSSGEELKMYGTYTLSRGAYNFTLQDIIIKDFTIEDGSSIAFHGDPYSAQLDIRAYYSLNANLSDLDESFLQDRELNRTNVPVHAVMNVTGDMRSPEITFDLEFPTLTQDTYRKVKSIVSTDDMMNRQIIYLLALNRFYTPDYMDATRGNELVSVASSTLSSQLSNILGQLSDKVNIAPSIRSDRGDFSDVEFDVVLSSHLLNNRLLLNGNLGYRDKSLNNNSFIGDFDIEYLLNRSGSIRLKAYNRYNDQNYYLKSALTTQGVGVMFRRDFDDMLDFIHRLRRKHGAKSRPSPIPPTESTDTIVDHGKHTTD